MTVQELIERLRQFPGDAEIRVTEGGMWTEIASITYEDVHNAVELSLD